MPQVAVDLVNRRYGCGIVVVGGQELGDFGVPESARRNVTEEQFVAKRWNRLTSIDKAIGDRITTGRRVWKLRDRIGRGDRAPNDRVRDLHGNPVVLRHLGHAVLGHHLRSLAERVAVVGAFSDDEDGLPADKPDVEREQRGAGRAGSTSQLRR